MNTTDDKKSYNDILTAVCDVLEVNKQKIMAMSRDENVMFARGLYMYLAHEVGLNQNVAVLFINKSRPMIQYYMGVAEHGMKYSRRYLDAYKQSRKILGLGKEDAEKASKTDTLTNRQLQKAAKDLKPDRHYTMEDELMILHAKESARSFMENYGKGKRPLVGGCVFTRK